MNLRALALGLFLAAGCANSGTVTERSPMTQDLAAYRTASVLVTVGPGIENPDVFKSQLTSFLEGSLKEGKVFADLVADGADLQIKVTLTKLDKPVAFAGVAAGESDATTTIELFDTKASKSIGTFDLAATSKRNATTSVNGVDTKTGEDPRKRALQNTADGIAKFVATHRGGGK